MFEVQLTKTKNIKDNYHKRAVYVVECRAQHTINAKRSGRNTKITLKYKLGFNLMPDYPNDISPA